nr:hypothetical protein [Tanacetum cinerariifolium]
ACLWDIEEEVEETLVGWLCVDPHVCQGAMMVILGLLRARNKMEADMMHYTAYQLCAFLPRALRHGAEAISSYCYFGNLNFRPNLGLGMGLPLTKQKEFSPSGFKRSASVVKSKGESEEREKREKKMLEDWDEVVSGGPSVWVGVDVDPLVCRGAMMVIPGLLRAKNKMEADKMFPLLFWNLYFGPNLVFEMGLPSTKRKEFSSSRFKRSSSVVKSKGESEKSGRRGRRGCWRIKMRVCLWDMEEDVEETLVGWLCVFLSSQENISTSHTFYSTHTGLLRARNKMEADMMLRTFSPRALRHGAEAISSYCYSGTSVFGPNLGLRMGLPLTKRKEFSSSGFKRSSSVVKSKEREKGRRGCWRIGMRWFLVGPIRYGGGGRRNPSWLALYLPVCQKVMMVILGLLRVRNKMEADMMLCAFLTRALRHTLGQLGPIVILESLLWAEFGLRMGLPSTKRKLLDLVQSAMRPSLSEQKKGMKGMLDDLDEVVFGGPYPSGLKGTSLIKNPTIIMLIGLFWFSKSLFVGYRGGGVCELGQVDLHVGQGAMMVILGLLMARNKMESDMMLRTFLPRAIRHGIELLDLVQSAMRPSLLEWEKGMLEDWDEVVSSGSHPSGLKGTSLIKNPTIIILEDISTSHPFYSTHTGVCGLGQVDLPVGQGAMMVILGLLRARNKMEADMMVLVQEDRNSKNFALFRLELFVMALRQLVPIVILKPLFWAEFGLGDRLTLLDLVQSAMRSRLSEGEKGAKRMLENWDEVVSGGTHPSGLTGTSLIKNPTIIMLI